MILKRHVHKVISILMARISFGEKFILLLRGLEKFFSGRVSHDLSASSKDCEKFLSQLSDLQYLVDYEIDIEYVDGEKRVWFFFNQIDHRYIFGGWIAVLNFILQLKRESFSVGILSREKPHGIEKHKLLCEALEGLEVIVVESGAKVKCTRKDVFIPYDWVTSYVLLAAKRKGHPELPIYYFCQEDESVFYCDGSIKAFVKEIHYAIGSGEIEPIFNSRQLRKYFSELLGNDHVLEKPFFEQAISKLDRSSIKASSEKKYVLVYGRPESHAERNMFEVVILLLGKAITKQPLLFEDIEFVSIGSSMFKEIPLTGGRALRMVDRLPYDEYLTTMVNSVAVVALMHAPHPSVPPFESVRNGVRTVVNCDLYGRDSGFYTEQSDLFYPAKTDTDSLSDALIKAVQDAKGLSTCAVNAENDRMPHPEAWSDSFTNVVQFLKNKEIGVWAKK